MDAALVDKTPIGTAGTLVAAALEMAGHYLQSEMLQILDNGLTGSLGGFLITLSVMIAIFIVAIGGEYKFGIWFLVGPPLFYFLILNRVPSTGVHWQFGARLHSSNQDGRSNPNFFVDEVLKEFNEEIEEGQSLNNSLDEVEVSWFFARWNKFVSMTVRAFTSVIIDGEAQSDLDFISRTQRYASVFHFELTDPRLRFMLQTVIGAPECVSYLTLDHRFSQNDNIFEEDQLQDIINKAENRLVFNSNYHHYETLKELYELGYFQEGGADVIPLKEFAEGYTCGEFWKLMVVAVKNTEAKDHLIAALGQRNQNGHDVDKILRDVAKKFIDEDTENPEEARINNEEQILRLLNAVVGSTILNTMREMKPEVARYFMKTRIDSYGIDNAYELGKANESNEIAEYNDPQKVTSDLYTWGKKYEYEKKGDYLNFMLALPYLQGVILFFLSFIFPFFAFVLIVPGRHHNFLAWMGLWAWVKSWDLGFAVVMRLDEVLYFFMPSGPVLTDAELNRPFLVFRELAQNDPTYSVYTYYNIIATMLGSVPFVTGFLFKRGGGVVLDAVTESYREFGGQMGASLGSFTRSLMGQRRITKSLKWQVGHALKPFQSQKGLQDSFKQFKQLINTDPKLKQLYQSRISAKRITAANKGFQKGLSTGGPELAKGANQFGQSYAATYTEASAERDKELLNSYIDLMAHTRLRNASRSVYSSQLVRKTVALDWFSHNYVHKTRYSKIEDMVSNEGFFPWSSQWQGMKPETASGRVKDATASKTFKGSNLLGPFTGREALEAGLRFAPTNDRTKSYEETEGTKKK